jgi:hypothetical protein
MVLAAVTSLLHHNQWKGIVGNLTWRWWLISFTMFGMKSLLTVWMLCWRNGFGDFTMEDDITNGGKRGHCWHCPAGLIWGQ